MAVKVNRITAQERWEDAKLRLLSQFSDKRVPERKDLRFYFGKLDVEADEFSVCINGKRHLFFHGGAGAEVLCKAVREGADAHLAFTHTFGGEPVLSIIDKKTKTTLAVVGKDSEPELQLPSELEDNLLDIGARRLPELYPMYNKFFQEAVDEVYRTAEMGRTDELSSSLAFQIVSEEKMVEPEAMCNYLLFLDADTVERVKKDAELCIRDYYPSESEDGDRALLASDLERLEKCFSPDYLLEGWLSLQVSQIGDYRGEVQTDDIARVASWALRDPEYRSYGDKIREWADAEAGCYNLKSDIVAKKQEKMVGPLIDNTPAPIKSVRKSLSVKF